MASTPTSVGVSEVWDCNPTKVDLHHDLHAQAPTLTAHASSSSSGPPSTLPISPTSDNRDEDHDNDDAVVPSADHGHRQLPTHSHTTTTALEDHKRPFGSLQDFASSPTPAPSTPVYGAFTPSNNGSSQTGGSNSSKKSSWDEAFYTFTPTPKPPPRLAPMPRSPPAARPPLIVTTNMIPTTRDQPRDHPQDLDQDQEMTLRLAGPKPRNTSAFLTHNRSLSHSQAHSHHGNNIFTLSPDPMGHHPGAGSPSLGSVSSMGGRSLSSSGPNSQQQNPVPPPSLQHAQHEHVVNGSILSHGSPATTRPSGFLHRHQPMMTPSSSRSNLFSNLPSPLTRSSLSSTSVLLRDAPPSTGVHHRHHPTQRQQQEQQQQHPHTAAISGWANSSSSFTGPSQGSIAEDGADISESSVLLLQGQPPALHPPVPDDFVIDNKDNNINNNSSAVNKGTTLPPTSSSSQRKIYPGLKNSVGPYKLLHTIGHGSFSEVKMAVDTRSRDHVAIKVMSRAMIQSSDRLGISVRRESDLLQSIQHPSIIGFREVVETSLQMCIVLDYASGGELFEYVAEKRAMATEADVQCLFAQLVDAVDYLHERNIVHRDLKLENVLLEPTSAPLRPKVKLTDFGLAKVIEADSPLLTTRCGSEDYAAPEVILGQPYDGRQADIWSLGVVLYALLVGFLPFNMRPGMSRKNFLSMIAHAEFGFPGEKVPTRRTSRQNLYPTSPSSAGPTTTPGTPSTTAATLLPSATPVDTPSSAALSEENTVLVPSMRGVSDVSDSAKDLVRWLLQTQGSKRPTARELKEHPWVKVGLAAMNN